MEEGKDVQNSKDNSAEIIFHKPKEENKVILPVSKDAFKEFIVSLLGQPRKITKGHLGNFSITIDDLKNFHFLLNRRIFQQNECSLIQINIVADFSDNSSVTVKTFEELEMLYEELASLISTSITIQWQFLVKFQDREAPEKQEIEIEVVASGGRIQEQKNRNRRGRSENFIFSGGYINYIISYTALSWGHDIEGLLAKQVNSHLTEEKKWKKWTVKNNSNISFFIGSIFFICFIVGNYFKTQNFKAGLIKNLEINTLNIDEKLNHLMTNAMSTQMLEHYYYSVLFTFIALICSVIIAGYFDNMSNVRSYSFLILTKASLKNKKQKEKEVKKDWTKYIVALILGCLGSLLANFIWSLL